MKAVLLGVAFVAGGVLTWLLTVHRETREVGPDAAGPTEESAASDASGFGGARSAESSGAAGSRWSPPPT